MKLKFKFTAFQMKICLHAVRHIMHQSALSYDGETLLLRMVTISILESVGPKFELSSFLSIDKNEYKRSLRFHEAYALYKSLQNLPIADPADDMERNLLLHIIGQKLTV